MKTIRIVGSVCVLGIYLLLTLATSPEEVPHRDPTNLINTTTSNMIVIIHSPGDSSGVILDSAVFVNSSLKFADTVYRKFFRIGYPENSWLAYQSKEEDIISFLPDSFSMPYLDLLNLVLSKKIKEMDLSKVDQKLHAPLSCILKRKNHPDDFVLNISPGQSLPILTVERGTNKPAPASFNYTVSFQSNGAFTTLRGTGNELDQKLREVLPGHGIYDPGAVELVTVTNQTGMPVKVIEEGCIGYSRDSGYTGVIYSWPIHDTSYYVLLKDKWGIRYPGIFDEPTMSAYLYKSCAQGNQLQMLDVDSFFLDKNKYVKLDRKQKTITFWINTGQSIPFTKIPLPDTYFADSTYSDFTFIIDRNNGIKDSLHYHVKGFYSGMNSKSELILK